MKASRVAGLFLIVGKESGWTEQINNIIPGENNSCFPIVTIAQFIGIHYLCVDNKGAHTYS